MPDGILSIAGGQLCFEYITYFTDWSPKRSPRPPPPPPPPPPPLNTGDAQTNERRSRFNLAAGALGPSLYRYL